MAFEVDLPAGMDVYLLLRAGVDINVLLVQEGQLAGARLPYEVETNCSLRDPPAPVWVTWLVNTQQGVRLKIRATDEAVERAIRKRMDRYSSENDGEAVLDRERKALWRKTETVLKQAGISYPKLTRGEAKVDRRAIDSLIELAEQCGSAEGVREIADLFAADRVVRSDREPAVRWLMKRFETAYPHDRAALALRIDENVVPPIGDDLIHLIENRRYGSSRAPLLGALARTKHPRAADVIASVLHEEHMALWGLPALARLKATQHLDSVRGFLRHHDANVRRAAKRALKGLGSPVDLTVLPVHVVKAGAAMPRGMKEWSTSLDMVDVERILQILARCVADGFGTAEIAEVMSLMEEMKPKETKTIAFRIQAGRRAESMWLSIVADGNDSADFHVFASAAVITRFRPQVEAALD